jgi:hypothetical protein
MHIEFEILSHEVSTMNAELLRASIKPTATNIRLKFAAILVVFVVLMAYWIKSGAISKSATLFCLATGYVMVLTSLLRKVEKDPQTLGHQTVKISPVRIDCLSPKVNSANRWVSVKCLLKSKNYFFLSFKNNTNLPIPLTAFNDQFEVAEFQRLVEAYISGEVNSASASQAEPARPFAWPPAPTTKQYQVVKETQEETDCLPVLGPQVDAMNARKLQLRYDGRDLVNFYNRFCPQILWRSVAIRSLQHLALFTFIVPFFAAASIPSALIYISGAAIVLIAVNLAVVISQTIKLMDQRPKEARTFEVETDFLRYVARSEWCCENFLCRQFNSAKQGPEGVCIFVGAESLMIMPSRCFTDESAINEFYERMQMSIG